MKSSPLIVLILLTMLPAPALAAPRLGVVLPKKTKNACIRKAARLATALKYDDALDQLAMNECSKDSEPQEQLWVSLMEGVLYHSLEQAPESKEAFCRALQVDPSARLPIARPSRSLRERFEVLRSECQERGTPEPEQVAVAQPGESEKEATLAEATPAPAAMPPPEAAPMPAPAVEPAPAPPSSDLGEPAPARASTRLGSLEVHAGMHGDFELNPRELRPLGGLSLQGSVHLGHGLRAGLGLTALGTARFLSRPVFVLLADVRLAYPLIAPREQLALHAYATGGPLLYTLYPAAMGARTGLGLALDVSRVRISLGASYEWRYHYRLEYGAPMVGLEVGWKLL